MDEKMTTHLDDQIDNHTEEAAKKKEVCEIEGSEEIDDEIRKQMIAHYTDNTKIAKVEKTVVEESDADTSSEDMLLVNATGRDFKFNTIVTLSVSHSPLCKCKSKCQIWTFVAACFQNRQLTRVHTLYVL